jgi:hypothetical protein
VERDHSPQQTAARGVALLIVLSLVVALVINKGFHGSDTSAAHEPGTPTATTVPLSSVIGNTTGTTVPGAVTPATTVVAATVPPPSGNTKVVVANGNTGVRGAAGRLGDTLTGAGFTVVKRVNALSKEKQAVTKVLYLEGFQGQATRVAQTIGTKTIVPPIQLMAEPLPISKADLGVAQIIVLLGTDIAR